MSGLAKTALLLAVLLGAAAYLITDRVGGRLERPNWVFKNHLLKVQREERLVVRPAQQGIPWARYTFFPQVVETETLEKPMHPAPYAAFGMESSKTGGSWTYFDTGFMVFGLMGGVSIKEWLEEIQLVMEVDGAGREHVLLRAVYGHEGGGQVHYYTDMSKPVHPVGWFRYEVVGKDSVPQVYYAHAGVAGEAGRGR